MKRRRRRKGYGIEYASIVLEFIASFEAPTEDALVKLPSAGVSLVLGWQPTAHGPMNGPKCAAPYAVNLCEREEDPLLIPNLDC